MKRGILAILKNLDVGSYHIRTSAVWYSITPSAPDCSSDKLNPYEKIRVFYRGIKDCLDDINVGQVLPNIIGVGSFNSYLLQLSFVNVSGERQHKIVGGCVKEAARQMEIDFLASTKFSIPSTLEYQILIRSTDCHLDQNSVELPCSDKLGRFSQIVIECLGTLPEKALPDLAGVKLLHTSANDSLAMFVFLD